MKASTCISLILILLVSIGSFMPAVSQAYAVTELSVTMKAKLDKLIANAEPAMKREIESLYGKVLSLQRQEQSADESNKTLQNANEERLQTIRQQLKGIDAEEIERLEIRLAHTREQYEPLFALYRAINKRNKNTESLKIAIELARLDIRRLSAELKAAKDGRTRTVKKIRGTLSAIDPLKSRIKSHRSTAGKRLKQFKSEWSILGPAIKKGDQKRVKASLTALVSHMSQLLETRQAIRLLETDIGAILTKAQSQLP